MLCIKNKYMIKFFRKQDGGEKEFLTVHRCIPSKRINETYTEMFVIISYLLMSQSMIKLLTLVCVLWRKW
jgi:hypothetical protein